MKRSLLFFAGALIVGVALILSCQKVELGADEIIQNAPNKPTPTLTISYSPSPGIVGKEVKISATVVFNDLPLTCGQVQLFYSVDSIGNPCPIASASDWVNVSTPAWDAPGDTASFTYTTEGFYGWKAQYESSGKGCDYENLTGNDAVKLDINIIKEECSEPLTITPFLVSGESSDGKLFTFKTKWVVKACEDFTDLKTQGGLTAGATVISTNPSTANIKTTKQNTIISWIQPTVNKGDEFVYEVVFTRTLKNACTEYDITGAWSAKAWKEVDDGEGGTTLEEIIAGYNNKIYFSTPCP